MPSVNESCRQLLQQRREQEKQALETARQMTQLLVEHTIEEMNRLADTVADRMPRSIQPKWRRCSGKSKLPLPNKPQLFSIQEHLLMGKLTKRIALLRSLSQFGDTHLYGSPIWAKSSPQNRAMEKVNNRIYKLKCYLEELLYRDFHPTPDQLGGISFMSVYYDSLPETEKAEIIEELKKTLKPSH
jgi:hypothetical protein